MNEELLNELSEIFRIPKKFLTIPEEKQDDEYKKRIEIVLENINQEEKESIIELFGFNWLKEKKEEK